MEDWLKNYWREHFPDVPLIVAFWGWEQASSWISPNYFPPYPSEEGLRQRVEAVREAGGHPFFWPSGYHWATTFNQHDDGTFELDDREAFEKLGQAACGHNSRRQSLCQDGFLAQRGDELRAPAVARLGLGNG